MQAQLQNLHVSQPPQPQVPLQQQQQAIPQAQISMQLPNLMGANPLMMQGLAAGLQQLTPELQQQFLLQQYLL